MTEASPGNSANAAVPSDFSWPTEASGYDLVSKIGQGAFATVYLGRLTAKQPMPGAPTETETEVAVKILNLDHVDSDLAEIRREVQAMRLSSHPNVLTCLTAFCYDIHLWLVTPLMRKGSALHCLQSVRHILYDQGLPVPALEPHIIYMLREALLGLAYIHENGQIHRDVKGGNLLLDANGDVKVADFGVSGWLVRAGQQQEKAKTFVGTPCWMAPEVMEQVNGYDTKADIWSLGITALELAKGYAPYARYPPMKVLILTIQEDPPSLDTYDQLEMVDDMDDNQVMEDYSRAFGQFIDSCLQKNPSRRLSCNELLASKLLSPMADETVRQERREALRRQVCDVCPDVGTVAIGPQSSQQQPGHVPISILLNTAKDRQPGTSWVFPDGSQIFASSVTNAASSDEVMTQLEEFAAQTGGENYQRNQVGTDQTATSCDLGVSVVPGTNVVNERAAEDDTDDDDDDLDEFMTQFEQSTGGENFQRPPHSTQ